MIFGKKELKTEKSRLPDLPSPKYSMGGAIANPPIEREDIENLPSFPDSPSQNSFSQAMIKDAVSDSSHNSDQQEDVQMEEWKPSNFKSNLLQTNDYPIEEGDLNNEEQQIEESVAQEEQFEDIEEEAPLRREEKRNTPKMAEKSKNEDIFIKIDKFHSARRSLYDLKAKLDDVNGLLRKIRETRLREEQELAQWEKELLHAKTRIANVTENIFEKVD